MLTSCPSAGKTESVGESLIVLNGLQKPLRSDLRRGPLGCGGVFSLASGKYRAMPNVTVTRRLKFNAAHRVHNPALSDEQNDALFGKCNNPNWHGHNYTLDVSVSGEIDPTTGYVIDLSQLKAIVEREVVEPGGSPQSESRRPVHAGYHPDVREHHRRLLARAGPPFVPAELTRLVLWETDNNYVEYAGE